MLVIVGVSTPAAAAVEERGKHTESFYDDSNVFHTLSTYFRVDYTNHYIRPYAYHNTFSASTKENTLEFRSSAGLREIAEAAANVANLTITTPTAFACGGAKRYVNEAYYRYYLTTGEVRIARVDAYPIETAC